MAGNNLKLCLDLDGAFTESSWPGEVVIITYRKDRQKAVQDLADRNIRYDELVLVDRFEAKAEVIADLGLAFYIDDQPEMIKAIPASVNVMLFRNEGNYDFEDQQWMVKAKAVVLQHVLAYNVTRMLNLGFTRPNR